METNKVIHLDKFRSLLRKNQPEKERTNTFHPSPDRLWEFLDRNIKLDHLKTAS